MAPNISPPVSPDLTGPAESANFLQAGLVLFFLCMLFNLSFFLYSRSKPPFPKPGFSYRASVRFDSAPGKNPTLLGLAVSQKGKVALLDSKSGIVQVFSPEGKFLARTPAELPGAGKITRPLGIAYGEKEELLLADTGNQRVIEFGADGSMRTLGKPGVFNGQFVLPSSLVTLEDSLFVLDSALCRIQQFNSKGQFVAKAGSKGSGPGSFLLPTALARDSASGLLVVDSRASTLSQYDFLLNFASQRKISNPKKKFTLSRVAMVGEGLTCLFSKENQEIILLCQNIATEVLTPTSLGLSSAHWTDIAGHENSLYLLDAKNLKVDIFDLL